MQLGRCSEQLTAFTKQNTAHPGRREVSFPPKLNSLGGKKKTCLIYLVVRAFHGSSMNVYRTILHESASSASRKLFFFVDQKEQKNKIDAETGCHFGIVILVACVAARSLSNRNPCVLPRPVCPSTRWASADSSSCRVHAGRDVRSSRGNFRPKVEDGGRAHCWWNSCLLCEEGAGEGAVGGSEEPEKSSHDMKVAESLIRAKAANYTAATVWRIGGCSLLSSASHY